MEANQLTIKSAPIKVNLGHSICGSTKGIRRNPTAQAPSKAKFQVGCKKAEAGLARGNVFYKSWNNVWLVGLHSILEDVKVLSPFLVIEAVEQIGPQASKVASLKPGNLVWGMQTNTPMILPCEEFELRLEHLCQIQLDAFSLWGYPAPGGFLWHSVCYHSLSFFAFTNVSSKLACQKLAQKPM
jgi:hypothetical protein